MTDATGPVLAADGTPLKRSLARALRAQKLRALMLIAPLLIFVLLTFVIPIGNMLLRSVENDIVQDTLPETIARLTAAETEGVRTRMSSSRSISISSSPKSKSCTPASVPVSTMR